MTDETSDNNEINRNAEAHNVRHEINNALTGIIGHTQLLNLRGELNEKSRERVEKIEALANRIRELAAGIG